MSRSRREPTTTPKNRTPEEVFARYRRKLERDTEGKLRIDDAAQGFELVFSIVADAFSAGTRLIAFTCTRSYPAVVRWPSIPTFSPANVEVPTARTETCGHEHALVTTLNAVLSSLPFSAVLAPLLVQAGRFAELPLQLVVPPEPAPAARRVIHPRFGEGMVRAERGSVLDIEFSDGRRRIDARFVRDLP